MRLAEALALGLDVAGVRGVVARDVLPVVREVAAHAVAALGLEVRLLRALEQGAVVPRRAVEDGRRVVRRGHRPEVAVELLRLDVLRLIDLEQQRRGVADDVRVGLGGEEDGARGAVLDGVARCAARCGRGRR